MKSEEDNGPSLPTKRMDRFGPIVFLQPVGELGSFIPSSNLINTYLRAIQGAEIIKSIIREREEDLIKNLVAWARDNSPRMGLILDAHSLKARGRATRKSTSDKSHLEVRRGVWVDNVAETTQFRVVDYRKSHVVKRGQYQDTNEVVKIEDSFFSNGSKIVVNQADGLLEMRDRITGIIQTLVNGKPTFIEGPSGSDPSKAPDILDTITAEYHFLQHAKLLSSDEEGAFYWKQNNA